MNTHVRDNFNETAPAQASSSGAIIVTTGANSVDERIFARAEVDTSESTSSTSYTDLTTSGPAVTVTSGTRLLIVISAGMSNGTAGSESRVGFAISGSTTLSATDRESLHYTSNAADDRYQSSYTYLYTSATAGSNTVTMKYRAEPSGTATFNNRRLAVLPL